MTGAASAAHRAAAVPGTARSSSAPLAGLTVGVYGSGGAPWHHLALAAARGASVRVVRAEDVVTGRLDELDVLVMPGGGAMAMAGLLAPLGTGGADALRAWVAAGGTYVSSCAGSVLPLALVDAAAEANPLAAHLRMVDVGLANRGDATLGGLASPGVGRIRVRLAAEHPYTAGLPATIELMHYNGPLFDTAPLAGAASPDLTAFAWPLGATPAFTPAERFMGGGVTATTLQRCIDLGAATAIDARVGHGRAVLFGSHPEFGLGPLLLGWGDAAELFTAALRACSRATGAAPAGPGWSVRREHESAGAAELAALAAVGLTRAADRFDELGARRSPTLEAWLAPGAAASFHGVTAATAWRRDTHHAAAVARCAAEQLSLLAPLLDAHDLPWLDDAARPDQDFGFVGLTQLVDRIGAMLEVADRSAGEGARTPTHAYDLFDTHPFHLAVGSYLSAAGLSAAALLVSALLAFRHGATTACLEARLWLIQGDVA